MNKDQLASVKINFPTEYEAVISDLYEWPQGHLIQIILKWIPESEFMKMIKQVEVDDGKR